MGGRDVGGERVGTRQHLLLHRRAFPWPTELPAEPEAAPDVSAAAPARLRILLVEDNPANQKLAAYILQDRGHTVEIAGDGQQALRMTRRTVTTLSSWTCKCRAWTARKATAAIRARDAGRPPRAHHRHDRPRHEGRPRALPGRRHGRLPEQADRRAGTH